MKPRHLHIHTYPALRGARPILATFDTSTKTWLVYSL